MANRPLPVRVNVIRELRDHPALPALIPTLPPRALSRLYDAVGMNDAGAMMALTPPDLLAAALDDAVWVDDGFRNRFDADVFIDWLEVWLNEGEDFAAERLLALDDELRTLCFSEVLRVEDSHVTAFVREADDAHGWLEPDMHTQTALFERFLVTAAREEEWDVVHGALMALWTLEPDTLLALLERLTAGDSRPTRESVSPILADAAGARDTRQERTGFVPAPAARAFLGHAQLLGYHELMALEDYDLESGRYIRQLERARREPISAAEADSVAKDQAPSSAGRTAAADSPGVWSLLSEAGVVDTPDAAGLLSAPGSRPLSRLQRRLDELATTDPNGLPRAGSELAYLANVLVSATDLAAPGPEREAAARGLASATAGLGLECLEAAGYTVDVGAPPGLVRTFLAGWHTLHELPANLVRGVERALATSGTAQRLTARPWLAPQMAESLEDLREAVSAGALERAREALGLLSLVLDTDACRAAAHLLETPPRFPGLLEGGDKDASRWIATADDLARLWRLLGKLAPPDRSGPSS